MHASTPRRGVSTCRVGYPEAIDCLHGRLAEAELPERISIATRRYAKRQVTWFRHQLKGPGMMLDASQPPDVLARELLSGYRAAVEQDGRR